MTNQAAERLRRANRSCIDYAALCESDARVVRDSLALAEAYLSENLPDDGEAIAKIWFCGQTQRLSPLDRALLTKLVDEKRITTRGQLRLLLRALGVEGEGK